MTLAKRCAWMIAILALAGVLGPARPLPSQTPEGISKKPFQPVQEHLLQSGLEPKLVQRTFDLSPSLRLETVASVLRLRESTLDYGQYLEPEALDKARAFLRQHRPVFERAEEALEVDRTAITAVLLVESRLGEYTGLTPVLDILATLSLVDRQEIQDEVWSLLPSEDRKALDRSRIGERLDRKAERARKDLRALLTWFKDRPEALESLQGSIMGAVGWPQFLPHNVLHYGADGDQDGRIDLFEPADSIFSVANYLRAAGWDEANPRARERAILDYNHSRPYMETILRIAASLRGS